MDKKIKKHEVDKKIKKYEEGTLFSTYKVYSINSKKLSSIHSATKIFIKIDENKEGYSLMPMVNSINYHEKTKYYEYIKEIEPDVTNGLKNISYVNCASEVLFINKDDCKYINEVGTLSKEDLIEVQEKIIHALCNNIKFEKIEIEFTKDKKQEQEFERKR